MQNPFKNACTDEFFSKIYNYYFSSIILFLPSYLSATDVGF